MGFIGRLYKKIKDGVGNLRKSKIISTGASKIGKALNSPTLSKVGDVAGNLGFRSGGSVKKFRVIRPRVEGLRRGGTVVVTKAGMRRGGVVTHGGALQMQRNTAGLRAGGRVRKRMGK